MNGSICSIVVAGGSAAGWIAAARLAAAFRATVSVTVLEEPARSARASQPHGIGSVPPGLQRDFFDHVGVPEHVWMRACCASFRVATRFVNWRTEGPAESAARVLRTGRPDHFYRPYADMPRCEDAPLGDFWRFRAGEDAATGPFDYACFREPPLMDARRSPRLLDGRAVLPYAWHVDLRMLRDFVRALAIRELGVQCVTGLAAGARHDAAGRVTALVTEDGAAVPGDLFLDCTGQESRLFHGILDEPFLPDGAPGEPACDSAVTITVAHDDEAEAEAEAEGIEPFGTAIALPGGWAWKTPLPGRFGAGLVFPSALHEPDGAARDLCALWGLRPEDTTVRTHRLRPGRSARTWVHNCVALGAAASVAEPLAADGPGDDLGDVLAAVELVIRDLPSRAAPQAPAARFDRAARQRHARTRDLARLHYAAAPRRDTAFWRARNTRPLSDALHELLDAHRKGLPPEPGQAAGFAVLSSLADSAPGADGGPAAPQPGLAARPALRRTADEHFVRIRRQQILLLESLPSAQAYLGRLHEALSA